MQFASGKTIRIWVFKNKIARPASRKSEISINLVSDISFQNIYECIYKETCSTFGLKKTNGPTTVVQEVSRKSEISINLVSDLLHDGRRTICFYEAESPTGFVSRAHV